MNVFLKVWYRLGFDRKYGRIASSIEKKTSKKLNIMNADNTVKYIIDNKCSVARFGDGEFHIASEGCSIGFQKADKQLQKELCGVLHKASDNLLICLPSPLNSCEYMTAEAQQVWDNDLKYNRYAWYKLIDKSKMYGDTQFTRPYIDYADRSLSAGRFELIKKIWYKRKVVIVEGEKSKLGVNNDLFESTAEIKRILCPSKDAFSKYDDILTAVKSVSKDYLILIALGPTATVLATDLSLAGYQAIDIGHIDIEYEWCRMQAKEKVQISGKFTNESKQKSEISDEDDPNYLSQIIRKVI